MVEEVLVFFFKEKREKVLLGKAILPRWDTLATGLGRDYWREYTYLMFWGFVLRRLVLLEGVQSKSIDRWWCNACHILRKIHDGRWSKAGRLFSSCFFLLFLPFERGKNQGQK